MEVLSEYNMIELNNKVNTFRGIGDFYAGLQAVAQESHIIKISTAILFK